MCSTKFYIHIVLHTRGWWEFSLADIKKNFEGVIYGQKSLMCKLCSLKRFPLKFTRVTHAHLEPILYHSKPSDVSYSQDQFLSWDLFHRFLQQDGSNCTIIQLLASRNSNGPSKLKCSMKESYVILKNYSYKFDCNYQDFACPLRLTESGQLIIHSCITNCHMKFTQRELCTKLFSLLHIG